MIDDPDINDHFQLPIKVTLTGVHWRAIFEEAKLLGSALASHGGNLESVRDAMISKLLERTLDTGGMRRALERGDFNSI